MKIPVTDAVRAAPVALTPDRALRRKIMEAARHAGSAKAVPGENAARSQDFLYDAHGLPARNLRAAR
jgi:hypothetical protein